MHADCTGARFMPARFVYQCIYFLALVSVASSVRLLARRQPTNGSRVLATASGGKGVPNAALKLHAGGVAARSTWPLPLTSSFAQDIVQYATTAVVKADVGGQEMYFMPDTGSFDMLLSSALCKSCGNRVFRTSESSSFTLSSPVEERNFYFGSGSLQAIKAFDSFTTGPFHVPQAEIWMVASLSDEVQSSWATGEFEGVLGLGLKRATTLESMDVSTFSLCLTVYGLKGEWWNGGVLYWNGRDESFYWGSAHPIRTSYDGMHWELHTSNVALGGSAMCSGGCSIVPDSGTSLLAVPSSHKAELQNALRTVPISCDLAEMPRLAITLDNGESLELPPAAYIMRLSGNLHDFDQMMSNGLIVYQASANSSYSGNSFCAAIFQVSGGPHWVLGMPLFRAYAVDFDRSSRTVSFAKNADGDCGANSGGRVPPEGYVLHNVTSSMARIAHQELIELPIAELKLATARRSNFQSGKEKSHLDPI